jgi:hypothetical protein
MIPHNGVSTERRPSSSATGGRVEALFRRDPVVACGEAGRGEGEVVTASGPVRQMVFVAHHVAGVRLIPRDWLDGFRPSGFREATPREIARWYEERELEPPVDGPSGDPLADLALTPPP